MTPALFLPRYFLWHYTTALKEGLKNFQNFSWFLAHFFSIPLLVRTFFAPWQRLNEDYQKGGGVEDIASTLVLNLLMRLVGMIVRSAVILFGLVTLLLFVVLSVVILAAWLLAPFIVVVLFILFLRNLFLWI